MREESLMSGWRAAQNFYQQLPDHLEVSCSEFSFIHYLSHISLLAGENYGIFADSRTGAYLTTRTALSCLRAVSVLYLHAGSYVRVLPLLRFSVLRLL
jgi:hypothetical protein